MAALLASRDRRTTIGANLALVVRMTGLDPWTAGRTELRAALETAEMSPVDHWRLQALKKLLAARHGSLGLRANRAFENIIFLFSFYLSICLSLYSIPSFLPCFQMSRCTPFLHSFHLFSF